MSTDDSTRAGGSKGASAPARVEDARTSPEALQEVWARWVISSRGRHDGRPWPRDEQRQPCTDAELADALDAVSTSELLETFYRGVYLDVRADDVTMWHVDRQPLADEIDRRIPRRRA